MSSVLLGAAFAANVPSQSAKLVLIKLVDCCDDHGKRIWPSIATLAQAAMCHPRHVKRVIRLFCEVGLLRMVRAGGRGAGSTACYEMDVALLRSLAGPDWKTVFAGTDDSATDTASTDDDSGAENEPQTSLHDGSDMALTHAHDACNSEESATLPIPVKGDMMSPLIQPRVTSETIKGDMMCHPTPQEEPLNLRERARERGGLPAPEIEALAKEQAGQATSKALPERQDGQNEPQPTLAMFLKRWPNVALDSQKRIGTAWALLATPDKGLALDGIERYLALQKSDARTLRISGATYLEERRWTLIEGKVAAAVSQRMVSFAALSKDWWHVLLGRIASGRPTSFMLAEANAGRGFSAPLADLPSEAQRAAMKGYPASSDVGQRWLGWLAARKLRLDVPGTTWLQLPGEWPPGMRPDDLGETHAGF